MKIVFLLTFMISCAHDKGFKGKSSTNALGDYLLTSPSEKLWLSLESTIGLKFCVNGDITKGSNIIKKAMLLNPAEHKYNYELGLCHALERKWHRSLYFLQLSLKKEPSFHLHNNLAVVYFELQNYEKAKEHFSSSLKLAKDPSFVKLNLAWFSYYSGNYKEAIKLFSELSTTLNSDQIQLGLAMSYYHIGDFKRSVSLFKQYGSIEQYAIAIPLALDAYMRTGEKDQATSLWPKLIKLEGNEAHLVVTKYASHFSPIKE